MISMIGQDASIFPYMGPFLCIFLAMPCNVVLPSIILTYYLREAFLVGLASCVLVSVLSSWAAAAYKRKVMRGSVLHPPGYIFIQVFIEASG